MSSNNFLKVLGVVLLLLSCRGVYSQIDFSPYTAKVVGSFPNVVCIDDVNGDGLKDVILGTSFYFDPINDYKIFVFIQNNNGELSAPVKYPYPPVYPGLRTMDIADLNNDGRKDIVIGYGDSAAVFFQNNSGTLNPIKSFYSGNVVDGVKCGDLNNDGLTDFAVCHWGINYVKVFYQSTPGLFNTYSFYKNTVGYDEIEIDDVNSDGKKDVVVLGGQAFAGIQVFLQTNNGYLGNAITYLPSGSTPIDNIHGIAIGDLNSDSSKDIVVSKGGNTPSSRMVIWYQDTITHQLITPPDELPAYDIPEPVVIADLNCDGKNEIVTAHGGWLKLSVYERDETGHYGSVKKFNLPYASHYQTQGIAIGDFTNDGREDIAIADYNQGLVTLINKSKPASYSSTVTVCDTDTINTHLFSNSVTYTFTSQFTSSGYLYTQLNTYEIIKTFYDYTVRKDSSVFLNYFICSYMGTDTLKYSKSFSGQKLIRSDTIFKSTRLLSVSNPVAEINLFPNPNEGEFTVELPTPFDQNTQIKIHNNLGQLIGELSFSDSKNRREISLGRLAGGIYYLSFQTPEHDIIEVRNLIIQH